jgi:hypothetical protein
MEGCVLRVMRVLRTERNHDIVHEEPSLASFDALLR